MTEVNKYEISYKRQSFVLKFNNRSFFPCSYSDQGLYCLLEISKSTKNSATLKVFQQLHPKQKQISKSKKQQQTY